MTTEKPKSNLQGQMSDKYNKDLQIYRPVFDGQSRMLNKYVCSQSGSTMPVHAKFKFYKTTHPTHTGVTPWSIFNVSEPHNIVSWWNNISRQGRLFVIFDAVNYIFKCRWIIRQVEPGRDSLRQAAHSPLTDRLMHITHQNKSWAQTNNSSLSGGM